MMRVGSSSGAALEGDYVRLLRFLGLLATLALAFFAGYIFHQRSLGDFFPPWVLSAAPPLRALARWLPDDLLTLALWLSAGAALGFGLLAPSWRLEARARTRPARTGEQMRRRVGQFLVAVTVGAAGAAGLASSILPDSERWIVQSLWTAAVLLYLMVCGLLAEPLLRANMPGNASGRDWLRLGGLLALSSLLFGWRSFHPPTLIDENMAHWGLEALALLNGADQQLFTANPSITPFAVAPLALAIGVSGDAFMGIRLIGILTALLTVLGVWLLAGELFRRTPVVGPYGETVEDAGQSIALWAALLTATSTVIIHYSRLPIFLEPVAWGVLGLWALLRAWRTQDGLAVGLSGMLIGLAALLFPSGIVFLMVAIGWWIGAWLLQPEWLHRPVGHVGPFRRPWLGLIWLGGIGGDHRAAAWVLAADAGNIPGALRWRLAAQLTRPIGYLQSGCAAHHRWGSVGSRPESVAGTARHTCRRQPTAQPGSLCRVGDLCLGNGGIGNRPCAGAPAALLADAAAPGAGHRLGACFSDRPDPHPCRGLGGRMGCAGHCLSDVWPPGLDRGAGMVGLSGRWAAYTRRSRAHRPLHSHVGCR